MSYLAPFYIPVPANAGTLEELYASVELMQSSLDADTKEFCETVWEGKIPEFIPEALAYDSPAGFLGSFSVSRTLQKRGYFARVTKSFIAELTTMNLGTVLDPFAGSGFLVSGLREAGIPAIATDDYSWKFGGPSEKLDALEAVRKYGHEIQTVVLSWVPYESTIDMEIYNLIQKDYPWLNILVISEGAGGCIGSEEFGEIIWGWDQVESYRTTYGLHDFCVFKPGDSLF